MVKEEMEILLKPLEQEPGFYGYAVIGNEGIVIHSKFKSSKTKLKETIMQLDKINNSFKDIGKTYGDDNTKYSLFELSNAIILIVPINDKLKISIFLQTGSDINNFYKKVFSLKRQVMGLVK